MSIFQSLPKCTSCLGIFETFFFPSGLRSLSIVANKASDSGAGSDYMSYTQLGYPAAFASEGDPSAGKFPGDYDPYVHTEKDTMHVDDEAGTFSLEVGILYVLSQRKSLIPP